MSPDGMRHWWWLLCMHCEVMLAEQWATMQLLPSHLHLENQPSSISAMLPLSSRLRRSCCCCFWCGCCSCCDGEHWLYSMAQSELTEEPQGDSPEGCRHHKDNRQLQDSC